MTLSYKRRPLTGPERAVLSLLAQGWTNRQVARHMEATVSAVEATVRRARRALDAENNVHAVYLALQTHQIPPTPCGTVAAYRWHTRRGDHPCAQCRKAWTEYTVRNRRELREKRRRNGLPTP